MALFHTVWTVVLFVLFIGIILWAWSRGSKPGFDEAARLPLEDDETPKREQDPIGKELSGDKTHG